MDGMVDLIWWWLMPFRHNSFAQYASSYALRRDGTWDCIPCAGSGKIYDPDDPPDCIEGNKLRRVLQCQKCKGSGIGTEKEWQNLYKKEMATIKSQNKIQKREAALIKKALHKLTKA